MMLNMKKRIGKEMRKNLSILKQNNFITVNLKISSSFGTLYRHLRDWDKGLPFEPHQRCPSPLCYLIPG